MTAVEDDWAERQSVGEGRGHGSNLGQPGVLIVPEVEPVADQSKIKI